MKIARTESNLATLERQSEETTGKYNLVKTQFNDIVNEAKRQLDDVVREAENAAKAATDRATQAANMASDSIPAIVSGLIAQKQNDLEKELSIELNSEKDKAVSTFNNTANSLQQKYYETLNGKT
jgi:hypothetical protein